MHDFILDNFVWSFSRIGAFDTCPYAFYLSYIRELKSADSFFGQYGSFVHELLEKYNKGLYFDFQLVDEYEKYYYEKVTEKVNDKISNSYYQKGYTYFSNFVDPEYKVISAEADYKFKVGKYNFVGKIDVETEDAILDYKTKTGEVFKRIPSGKTDIRQLTDNRYIELEHFKQLYTYCIPYFNKYEKYPKNLILEMVKMNDTYVLPFNYDDFLNVQSWLINRIEEIYRTIEFKKYDNDFWCSQICGQRYNCDRFENIIYKE